MPNYVRSSFYSNQVMQASFWQANSQRGASQLESLKSSPGSNGGVETVIIVF